MIVFYTTPVDAAVGGERERERERAREKERERAGKSEREREREREREGEPYKRVRGVGEEAYWIGTNANGTLYAFKKDRLVRISIGGPGKDDDRLRRAEALAQKALARL